MFHNEMEVELSKTTEIPGRHIYRSMFASLDPINIIVGALIIVFNSVLVFYYSHNSRTLTKKLFILIAVSDILFSVGSIIKILNYQIFNLGFIMGF